MTWVENDKNNAATMIFVPCISKLDKKVLNEWGKVGIEKIEVSDAGWVVVSPLNNGKKRILTLYFSE